MPTKTGVLDAFYQRSILSMRDFTKEEILRPPRLYEGNQTIQFAYPIARKNDGQLFFRTIDAHPPIL